MAVGRFSDRGLDDEMPGEEAFSDFSNKRKPILDMVQELDSTVLDPVYALDPLAECQVGGDDLPYGTFGYKKLKAPAGGTVYRVVMEFLSSPWPAYDAAYGFMDKLPAGKYAAAAAFMYDGDGTVYANTGNERDGGEYDYTPGSNLGMYQQDEYLTPEDGVDSLRDLLKEGEEHPTLETLATGPVIETIIEWYEDELY